MKWEQGQHVCIVGQTGQGKTYLENELLQYRQYVLFLRSKSDKTQLDGFRVTKKTKDINLRQSTKWELYPTYEEQYIEFKRALGMVWRTESWCVALDETFYLYDNLRLKSDIEKLLTQGRSLDISVVCGIQRPSRVSRFVLSEPYHYFFFQMEGRDAKLVGEVTTPRIVPVVEQLRKHEFAYYDKGTRRIVVAKAQYLDRI